MALSLRPVKVGADYLKVYVNGCFCNKEPWQIVTITATSVLAGVWLFEFCLQSDESLVERCKKTVFRMARRIPFLRDKLDAELRKIKKSFEKDVVERYQGQPFVVNLPYKGKSRDQILEDVGRYLKLGDFNWKEGYVSGSVYCWNQELVTLLTDVYGATSYTNPLHPDIFPGVNKMEAEVVRISCNLFHGGSDSCGTMTTGGTESIIMACKAYRDYARDVKGIKKPEIIVPVTAHSAFDKAASYLGLHIKHIPVREDTTVDIDAMRRAISRRTCMLVGSAPNFPYGTIDDIAKIGELGVYYGIPVHVDACLGGFVAAFVEHAGYTMPPFDFRVPGVTSISADTHKYGFSPKGSSVILYSESMYRSYQYTVTTDWPGGVYGSPTVGGSRAGGLIATCWATFMFFGMQGYVDATKKIVETTKFIEKGLRGIDGIFVYGIPVTSVIAIGSKIFHVYKLQESLQERGWNLNTLQFPSGIHLCVTHLHTEPGVADRFLKDVSDLVIELKKSPGHDLEGKMAIYGTAQSLPDRSIVGDFTRLWIDSLYHTGSVSPNVNGK